MKILAVVSAIDLALRQAVPSWWQLFKGLYELGTDLVVIPYVGRSIESLWWRSYNNPCEIQSRFVNRLVRFRINTSRSPSKTEKKNLGTPFTESFIQLLANVFTAPKWLKTLRIVLEKECDVDAVLFFNVPPNQIKGIPTLIQKEFGIPSIFYDMDAPDSIPGFSTSRLAFNWYSNVDLSEYSAIILNSEGAIPQLEHMGGHNVHAVHFGIDPDIFRPVPAIKDIDVFFYGQGDQFRENWINHMITVPSRTLTNSSFLVGGKPFRTDIGDVKRITNMPISSWVEYCCRSKINLNITRKHHAEVFCSSTARIFELASIGCCIVSSPVNGLDKWFSLDDEVIVVNSEKEAIETYNWLLPAEDIRFKMSEKARQRVLKEHTHKHMAKKLLDVTKKYT
ncbi:MAG: glycosyltransferase [Candidatus Bathyarchaeota archaeon]|nr:glycosyltransferase [Candidatus Bathyarchaeum sp.]